MEIRTDHKWKNLLFGYQLTEKERADFDWMGQDEIDHAAFIRYRRRVYAVSEFMRAEGDLALLGWQGVHADSYFSGIVIKVSKDGERYMVGSVFS